jgi:enhancer of mRNA-decapping protein 3
MDNHDNMCLREQAWYQKVVGWANQNKASVLGIDPPVEGGAIDMKWSLSVALPLALSTRCGQVYLCDLSLPNKLYGSIGIKYASPFAHKFVIPLHNS